jgi:hypothetical protein
MVREVGDGVKSPNEPNEDIILNVLKAQNAQNEPNHLWRSK